MSVIAVDVDLTVVDTLTPWMNEFFGRTGENIQNLDGAYDLMPEMKRIMQKVGVEDYDPYAFWKRADLYDAMMPVYGSYRILHNMALSGHNIVFVSSCVPEHTASKQRFLQNHFPFADGFIATHDKHFVGYDMLIDDKIHHIEVGELYRPSAQHILFTGIRIDGGAGAADQYIQMMKWDELPSIAPKFF